MTDAPTRKAYVIDSENEAERLEAQARLAGIEDHLAPLALPRSGVVLDVGCGSGAMARLIARDHPALEVVGIDGNASYLDFAEGLRRAEGLENLRFEAGDAFALPFDDGAVDVPAAMAGDAAGRGRRDGPGDAPRRARGCGELHDLIRVGFRLKDLDLIAGDDFAETARIQ